MIMASSFATVPSSSALARQMRAISRETVRLARLPSVSPAWTAAWMAVVEAMLRAYGIGAYVDDVAHAGAREAPR